MSDVDDLTDDVEEEVEDDTALDLSEFELGDDTENEGSKDDAPDPKIEAAKATARAKALEEELARMREAQELEASRRVAPKLDDAPAPQTSYKSKSLEELIPDDFEAQFVADPKGALRKAMAAMREDVVNEVRSSSTGTAASVVDNEVRAFLADQRESDPETYALAAKLFRERVDATPMAEKAALANLPSTRLREVMETAWAASVGKATIENRKSANKDATTRRVSAPPPTVRGSSSPGSGTVRGGSSTFTRVERQMIEMGKSAGLKKKDIDEMIREHRAEQRAAREA
jgi:hypothetical protein